MPTEALKKYSIFVKTADVNGAGTDANVHLTIYGREGSSATLRLEQSETHWNKFEKGHTDLFVFSLPDLGKLVYIEIGHDNTRFGSSWLLDSVNIKDELAEKSYLFKCSKYLGGKEPSCVRLCADSL